MNLFAIPILVLLLTACSAGVPGDKSIESAVRENALSNGFEDLFVFENFKKTNGFRKSDSTYIVDIEYDLVFQKSFIEVVKEIGKNPTGPQYGIFGAKLVLASIQSNFGQFEIGDKIHKVSKVIFHNTEKGWQLSQP